MPFGLLTLARMVAVLRGLLPLVVALLLWQLFGTGSAALPPPLTWWTSTLQLARSGALLPAIGATMIVLMLSLTIASTIGFCVGLLIGMSTKLQQWLGPLLEYFRAIPPPVLIPVLVLALGYTSAMKIIVVGFAAFWPVLLNTTVGVGQIKPLTFEVASSFRLSWAETLFKIVVPSAVPSLLLGLRVALPHTIILTLVTEIFTDATGLGGLMMTAERNYNAPTVFGLLVVIGILGFLLSSLFSAIERGILRRWPSRAN
jgi:ABC-type nitrate/sulfonate/bicarbonate transport system permease component